MNVAMIGSGNVAWHLALALENTGYKAVSVYSQNISNAKALTKRLYEAAPSSSLDFSDSSANLFIIAVSDDSIEEVAKELILPEDAIVVHTSGSKPVNILWYVPTEHIGVFYPLQTFSKAKRVDFTGIPILIESDDAFTKNALLKLGKMLSSSVHHVQSKDRQALHVSAVFACNFTNHLFTISEKLLTEKGIDFNLLKPLITETINKSLAIGSGNSQTGPAIREDFGTLEKHMQYLEEHEEFADIYKMITQNIINTYSE